MGRTLGRTLGWTYGRSICPSRQVVRRHRGPMRRCRSSTRSIWHGRWMVLLGEGWWCEKCEKCGRQETGHHETVLSTGSVPMEDTPFESSSVQTLSTPTHRQSVPHQNWSRENGWTVGRCPSRPFGDGDGPGRIRRGSGCCESGVRGRGWSVERTRWRATLGVATGAIGGCTRRVTRRWGCCRLGCAMFWCTCRQWRGNRWRCWCEAA